MFGSRETGALVDAVIIVSFVVLFFSSIRDLRESAKRGERCECCGDCSICKIQCRTNEKYYGIQRNVKK